MKLSRSSVLSVALFLVACGGGVGGNRDATLDGAWFGKSTVAPVSLPALTYDDFIEIKVDGGTTQMFDVCPNRKEAITFSGQSGNSLTWTGELKCNPVVEMLGCGNFSITYGSMQLDRSGDTITIAGTGMARGDGGACTTRQVSMVFKGAR